MARMVSSECVASVGMTEPDTGSDLQGIRTTAKRDGEDWIINGSKTYITKGGWLTAVSWWPRLKPMPSEPLTESLCSSWMLILPASIKVRSWRSSAWRVWFQPLPCWAGRTLGSTGWWRCCIRRVSVISEGVKNIM